MNNEALHSTGEGVLMLPEAPLREVLLAQAIEQVDRAQTLVSAPERAAALQAALAGAQARGVARPRLADVLLAHSAAVVQRAAGREGAIAALHAGDARGRWLMRALPLIALALGLAADRVANAHRVDLLSPPLLLVLGWNLLMYASLLGRALLRGRPGAGAAGALPQRWLHAALARLPGSGRGLAARIAADFHARWLAATPALQGVRLSRTLHLCAAAWGAGLALSLLLRGLVVRYQFGWESTFLDAAQVHAIARVLFAPLTVLGLEPFSLAEIAAAQDFAGTGTAGGRWVWMYVGLLALVVVLPRLALAGGARWREARLARQCRLDLDAAAFDGLRAALPTELVLGVVGAGERQGAALLAVLALHRDATGTALADTLRAVLPDDVEGRLLPVDAVLLPWATPAPGHWPLAWQKAPALALPWDEWGASWPLEPLLPERLIGVLPRHTAALQRLAAAWQEGNRLRLRQAAQLLARHLRACAAVPTEAMPTGAAQEVKAAGAGDGTAPAGPAEPAGPAQPQQSQEMQQLRQLQAELCVLHALHPDTALPAALPATLPAAPTAGAVAAGTPAPDASAAGASRSAGDPLRAVVGTSAGAAAGAAAGAKAGALLDLGLGGLTLGAGTALGALLGGAAAWTLQGRTRRPALPDAAAAAITTAAPGTDPASTADALRASVQAACLLYLLLTHQARLAPPALQALAARWPAALDAALDARWPALRAALHTPASEAEALPALLVQVLQEVLDKVLGQGVPPG